MTDQPKPGEKPGEIRIEAKAFVLVSFSAEDPTTPGLTNHGCTMGQLAAAAWLIDQWLGELRAQQLAQSQLGGLIAGPGIGNVLAQLTRQQNGGNGA